jgi:hypothetical protein
MTFIPIPNDVDDDSEWWELDSLESIPATAAQAGLRSAATRVLVAASPARSVRGLETLAESAPAMPRRTRWATRVVIAGGVILGAITFALTYALTSNSLSSKPSTVAGQPRDEAKTPDRPVAEASGAQPRPASSSEASGPAAHQAVIDALAAAYNEIADGYAQIRDGASIPEGERRIAGAVERLKAAAQRGRSLAPLDAGERPAFARSSGPPLLHAGDRVIQELHRLKATPGIKADFDRLIAAYTRSRQEIEREMQGNPSGPPAYVGPAIRPPSPKGAPHGFSGPRGQLRGRR